MQNSNTEAEWLLARQGIHLLLNNKIAEAERLFGERKDNVQMAAGYCFVTFMNALMTFEEDKLEDSLKALRDIESRCAQDIGWLKSMKNKVFGESEVNGDDIERLEEQIILADSQVCVALLTFLQQDLSSYVKGGWVLRKAWKVYQHTYTQILQLYKKTFGCEEIPGSDFPSWKVITRDSSCSSLKSSPSEWSVPSCNNSTASTPNGRTSSFRSMFNFFGFGSDSEQSTVPPEVVSRLMSAVSFGYGIFQLCISLLPPSLLTLIHFLGFEGDRKVGISALMFARQSHDMRAPLATLALLWYHTIVRPFYALDGSNVQAGVECAEELISDSEDDFKESALFLFFRGRVERLKSNISKALEAYQEAVVKSPQREIQLLCLHEVGWCHLIHLDWMNAHHCFLQLKLRSRWSKVFYTYLAAVCIGSSGNTEEALLLIPRPSDETLNQQRITVLEAFIIRRTSNFPTENVEESYFQLLALELLFLWNALPSCSKHNLGKIVSVCKHAAKEPMIGLKQLLMGAARTCLQQFSKAEENFRNCLREREPLLSSTSNVEHHHITVFVLYELGVLLCRNPETKEEGKSFLLQAQSTQSNFKGYDFENRLKVRIHAALRNLNRP